MDGEFAYLVLLAVFGFVSAFLLIPVTNRLSRIYGVMSRPGGRKIHTDPVPLLGGLAIVAPLIVFSLIYIYLLISGHPSIHKSESQKFISFFCSAAWILILGILDDKWRMGWRKKLLGQILGITILFFGGHTIGKLVLPFYGLVDFGFFGYPIFGFIVLLIMNSVNLIDGMDGLAGGVCLFASITCGVLAYHRGDFVVAAIASIITGSLLAFLRFNFPPASVFMGDSGSLSLGFILSVLATSNIVKESEQHYTTLTTMAALLLPFAIALIDVALAVARRGITGREIFLPDDDHIHHRFMELFKSPRLVVGIFYIFSGIFCALTLLITMTPESTSTLALGWITVLTLVAVMAIVLRLYRIDRFTRAFKNRYDCKFLSSFNSYMKKRIERANSVEELLLLLERAVLDLDFDKVEVTMDGRKPCVWNNRRQIHPEFTKKNGARSLKNSEVMVSWVMPTHHDENYQKYLELVWYRFLNQVEDRNSFLGRNSDR